MRAATRESFCRSCYRGFQKRSPAVTSSRPTSLASALSRASETAYQAVSKPVEGTILTVAREAAAAAEVGAGLGCELPDVLERALRAASDAVAATPTQLEVLRKAGVVDSGGEGYRVILEGAWMWSTGRSLEVADAPEPATYSRALVQSTEDQGDSTFGFCTELLLRDGDLPLGEVKARMEELGESVIAVGDSTLMRVHVHTLRPGQVLEFAVDHGTLAKVKVENMQLQHDALVGQAGQSAGGDAESQRATASSIGVIAVAAGEGFSRVFRSLGARVVQGGQTMNPSVQEILAAVNSSGYQELIILPNNSNIILTAKQVPGADAAPRDGRPDRNCPAGYRRPASVQLPGRYADKCWSDGSGGASGAHDRSHPIGARCRDRRGCR